MSAYLPYNVGRTRAKSATMGSITINNGEYVRTELIDWVLNAIGAALETTFGNSVK